MQAQAGQTCAKLGVLWTGQKRFRVDKPCGIGEGKAGTREWYVV